MLRLVVSYVVALLLLQVVVVLAFGVETKQVPLEMLEDELPAAS